jgi:hypothetical protein
MQRETTGSLCLMEYIKVIRTATGGKSSKMGSLSQSGAKLMGYEPFPFPSMAPTATKMGVGYMFLISFSSTVSL